MVSGFLLLLLLCCTLFFFNDTATTEIYTLSLHDALPISWLPLWIAVTRNRDASAVLDVPADGEPLHPDRKSTRLNSSHPSISYAVFCLKKKKKKHAKSSKHHRTAE